MSAWIVDREHIDALVLAAVQWQVLHPTGDDPSRDDLDGVGRMLWAECLASVAYRYPGDGDGQRPGPAGFRDADVTTYRFTPIELVLDPYVALKVVNCYAHQSCEHPGWEHSTARDLTRQLTRAITRTLGPAAQTYRTDPRYQAAPWGVEQLDQLLTRAGA